MFQTYQARKLIKVIEARHGHTQPWVILCEGNEGLETFVVKVFTEEHLLEKPRVHGEFAGSWLATEFDLLTPEVAWIEFDQDFIQTLPPNIEQRLDFHDDRLKFGSKVLRAFQHFPKGIRKDKFAKLIDLDTLFAVDNLIRNSDRGSHKPNLLLTEDAAFLIDHEYALDIDDQTISQIQNLDIIGKFTSSHIAFPALYRGKSSAKSTYFEVFFEYLKSLNLQELEVLLREVDNNGYQANIGMIMEYFRFVKGNPSIFVSALKRSLQ